MLCISSKVTSKWGGKKVVFRRRRRRRRWRAAGIGCLFMGPVKNKASSFCAWEMGVTAPQASWFNKMDAGCNYVIEEKSPPSRLLWCTLLKDILRGCQNYLDNHGFFTLNTLESGINVPPWINIAPQASWFNKMDTGCNYVIEEKSPPSRLLWCTLLKDILRGCQNYLDNHGFFTLNTLESGINVPPWINIAPQASWFNKMDTGCNYVIEEKSPPSRLLWCTLLKDILKGGSEIYI